MLSLTQSQCFPHEIKLENTIESDAKIAQIKKIHKNFGNASIKSMQKRIGNAKLLAKDISLLVKTVVNICETNHKPNL